MLDVGKPCTHTSAGAPGVPQRRENTVTSRPPLVAVVDAQRSSVPPLRHSSKMSTPESLGARPLRRSFLRERDRAFLGVVTAEDRHEDAGLLGPHLVGAPAPRLD